MPSSLSLRALAIALSLGALAGSASAAPQFAHVFGDHAVLQRSAPIHVWGTAKAGDAVTVSLSTGETFTATADASGKWMGELPPVHAGGPFTLSAAASDGTTTLKDIMIGDVFLCSGQSNMEFPERLATGAWGDVGNAANNGLRFIIVPKDSEPAPLADMKLPAEWKVVGPDTIGDASAVCYHMAQAIQKQQNVAIGMIDSYWGGTTIQSWISDGSLRTNAKYTTGLDAVALLAKDPTKAYAAQSQSEEAWWDAHDASNKANRMFLDPAYHDKKDKKDKAWLSLTADKGWKDAGVDALKDFDGVAWMRTTVTLTADQAAKANELLLGPIDTYDTTWVNGTWVGSSSMSWLWRDYTVPAGTFKAGDNTIMLRVMGGGGLTGQPANRVIKLSDGQVVPLPLQWKIKPGLRVKGLSIPPAPWAIPTSLTTLYNGMIAPLEPYTLKGAAWYQGEANAEAASEYAGLLTTMFADWRQKFDNPTLPFLVVQLSSYGSTMTKPGQSNWAELRESQRRAVNADPHAGMAVSLDFGDRSDIHPTQKTVIGNRLARAAQAVVYGQDVTPGGPDVGSVTRSGNDIVVHFRNTNGGLQTYSSNDAIGFEVCTAPNVCDYAYGTVQGDNVVLMGANKPEIKIVRYAWADAPYINLYSKDDLPAIPFTADLP